MDEKTLFRVAPQRAVQVVAGTDCVDLDAEGGQFQGEGLGQSDAAELAARIGVVGFRADQAALGVDLDDVGEVLRIAGGLDLHHVARHLGAIEKGVVVDFSNKFKGLRGQGLQVSGAGDAGIGDEAVQCTELPDRLADQGADAVHLGDVGLDEDGPVAAADRVEGSGRLLSGHFIQVGDHDVGAFTDQFAGDAFAEALGGSGDDDGLAFHPAPGGAGGHFAAVVLDLPVVDEADLAAVHRMRSAETAGAPCDLDAVQEYFGHDAGVLGVVADGQQAHARHQDDLGRMAASGDVTFDGLFGCIRIRSFQKEVFALAVNDPIRGERLLDGVPAFDGPLRQGVGRDLDGLQPASGAAQDGTHGGNEFGQVVILRLAEGSGFFALLRMTGGALLRMTGQGLHACFQLRHDPVIDVADLGGRVCTDEDAMVLQENDLRLGALLGAPGLDPVVDLAE